jgi:hypothetical protein
MLTLNVNADTNLRWTGMALEDSGAPVNNATVTFALKDKTGATVATGSLAYVASSSGDYLGVLPSTTPLTLKQTYWLYLTAVSGQADGYRECECIAGYQDED